MNAPFQSSQARSLTADPIEIETIVVVGLGYVGLPVAVALAERLGPNGSRIAGFDISRDRIEALQAGHDSTREIDDARLAACGLEVSDRTEILADATTIIVTVPQSKGTASASHRATAREIATLRDGMGRLRSKSEYRTRTFARAMDSAAA